MNKNKYARFYGLLHKNPSLTKEEAVLIYTDGRTTSLKEMTDKEYNAMCIFLESGNNLKLWRSNVLHLMSKLGIDTSNWDNINQFCLSEKIAGKLFYYLTVEELKELNIKLRSIEAKGGLKKAENPPIAINIKLNSKVVS